MTTKEQLLRLMNHADHSVAIKRALNSGLLPSNLRKRWAETFVKRGINEVLGKSDCPAWEAWARDYLSGNDLAASSIYAMNSAREAMWNAAYSIDVKKHATLCAVYAITLAAKEASWNTLDMVILASEAAVKAASLRPCLARLTGWPTAWLTRAAAWLFKRDGKRHTKAIAEADETKRQHDDLLAIINEMP